MAVETVPQTAERVPLRVVKLSEFKSAKREARSDPDRALLIAVAQDLLERAKSGRLQALVFVLDDTQSGRVIGQVAYGPDRAFAAASQMAHRFAIWMHRVYDIRGVNHE